MSLFRDAQRCSRTQEILETRKDRIENVIRPIIAAMGHTCRGSLDQVWTSNREATFVFKKSWNGGDTTEDQCTVPRDVLEAADPLEAATAHGAEVIRQRNLRTLAEAEARAKSLERDYLLQLEKTAQMRRLLEEKNK